MSGKRRLWRLTAMLAVVVVAVGVAVGCGGDDDEGGGEGVSVGLVTDTGGVNDRGFNEFSIAGLDQAAEELGVETQVYVSRTADDYLPNLTAAAEDGHGLVIAVGFLLAPSTIEVAQEFPDTSFAGVDHFYGGEGCEEQRTCEQPNAAGMQYPSEEAGYLAGIVGAIDGACEEGGSAIGVDADQSAEGDCVITSALKPLQESVFQVINSFIEGTFEGGTNLF